MVEKLPHIKLLDLKVSEDKISIYFNISVNEDFDFQDLINSIKGIDQEIDFNMVESGVNW